MYMTLRNSRKDQKNSVKNKRNKEGRTITKEEGIENDRERNSKRF